LVGCLGSSGSTRGAFKHGDNPFRSLSAWRQAELVDTLTSFDRAVAELREERRLRRVARNDAAALAVRLHDTDEAVARLRELGLGEYVHEPE
jgi:hypothetical protein